MPPIKGVCIGYKFKKGKILNEVVDILEKRSLKTGEIVGYICIARGIGTLATNEFETPFYTVVANRIK